MITKSKNNLCGLILVGGRSSRMGQDKGALEYIAGINQVTHLHSLLSEICKSVFISCRPEQITAEFLSPWRKSEELLFDDEIFNNTFDTVSVRPLEGPLIGILSAFKKYPESNWLVVACDLPFLTKESLCYLLEKHLSAMTSAVTAYLNPDPDRNWPEPLCAIYTNSAQKYLLEHVDQGFKCPRKILTSMLQQNLVNTISLRKEDLNALSNINTPQEFKEAKSNLPAYLPNKSDKK